MIFFFRLDVLHKPFHKIAECIFVRACAPICFLAAFDIAGICNIVILSCIAEYFGIILSAVFPNKVFQKYQVSLVLLVNCNFCFRNALLPLQGDVQQRTIIHCPHFPQKIGVITELCQNALKIFFIHAECDRVQFFVCFISKQISGGYFSAGEQRYNGIPAEGKFFLGLLGWFIPAEYPCFECGLFLIDAIPSLHDLLDSFAGNRICPRGLAFIILVEAAKKFRIRLLEIAELIRTCLRQKMPPVGNQPCAGKINKANISGRISGHKVYDQVVDRRVFAIIFFIVNTAVEYPNTVLCIFRK